jgi:hypothetical protein
MRREAVRNHPSRHVDDSEAWHDLRIDSFTLENDEMILSSDWRTT